MTDGIRSAMLSKIVSALLDKDDSAVPRGRVLVWEDDAALRSLLLDLLADDGYVVTVCSSLVELQTAATQRLGDVAVADSWGPSHLALNGDERKQIGQLGRHVPTVLLSSRGWAHKTTAAELGVSALLLEPMDIDDFSTAVRAVAPALAAHDRVPVGTQLTHSR
jgi:DNA-binding response OmpR family regulator